MIVHVMYIRSNVLFRNNGATRVTCVCSHDRWTYVHPDIADRLSKHVNYTIWSSVTKLNWWQCCFTSFLVVWDPYVRSMQFIRVPNPDVCSVVGRWVIWTQFLDIVLVVDFSHQCDTYFVRIHMKKIDRTTKLRIHYQSKISLTSIDTPQSWKASVDHKKPNFAFHGLSTEFTTESKHSGKCVPKTSNFGPLLTHHHHHHHHRHWTGPPPFP